MKRDLMLDASYSGNPAELMRIIIIILLTLFFQLAIGQTENVSDSTTIKEVDRRRDTTYILAVADTHKFQPDSFDELRNRASVAFGMVQTKIFDQGSIGLSFELYKHLFKNKFAVGLGLFMTRPKTPNDSFPYLITDPKIDFGEFYLVTQYTSTLKKWLKLSYNLSGGYAFSTLYDNDTITYNGKNETKKEIAGNRLYTIEPGISCSLKLFNIDMDYGVMWLTIKANYRHCWGDFEFGSSSQHNGMLYWAGLTYNYRLF